MSFKLISVFKEQGGMNLHAGDVSAESNLVHTATKICEDYRHCMWCDVTVLSVNVPTFRGNLMTLCS